METCLFVKRVRPCFLSIDEQSVVDLGSVLSGRLETFERTVVTAHAHLHGIEVELTEDDLRVLRAMSDNTWEDVTDVCSRAGVPSILVDSLIQNGLVFTSNSSEPNQSDPASKATTNLSTWNKYAVLYHFMNKWRDMHLQINLPAERERLGEVMSVPEEVFEEFVRVNGRPPPAFKSIESPAFARILPIVSRSDELFDSLLKRKTTRSFEPDRGLTLDEFSTLMYYTFGCQGYSPVFREIVGLKKTSPSGGCLHPIEVYPLVMAVDDVVPGLYHYNVESHRLDAIRALSTEQARTLANVFTAGQAFPQWCSVLFIMTARFYRNHWKYRNHPRSYTVLYMDAAHLSQTLYLISARLGLGAFVTAAINGANIEDELGLDGFEEGAVALCGSGVPTVDDFLDPAFSSYIPRQTPLGTSGKETIQ